MGLFGSSSSPLDDVRKDCVSVSKRAQDARDRCDRSLRGKHKMMEPEERAELLKQALACVHEAKGILEQARRREQRMEDDHCPSEDILAAHSRVLEASLDIQRAEQSIEDGKRSLAEGLAEIEEFFGASSPEARQVRKVLADLSAS